MEPIITRDALLSGRKVKMQNMNRYMFSGVDVGRSPKVVKQLLDNNDPKNIWYIFKVPGHSTWAGVGLTTYSKTYYLLMKVQYQDGCHRAVDVYQGVFGNAGQTAVKKMVELYNQVKDDATQTNEEISSTTEEESNKEEATE